MFCDKSCGRLLSSLVIIFSFQSLVHAQLLVSSPDLALEYNSEAVFRIELNTPIHTVGSSLKILVNHDKVLSLDKTVIPVPNNVSHSSWNVTVTGKHPGNAILHVKLDPPEAQIKDAVIHIAVEKDINLGYASDIIGWIYFTAWTVSFYPQIFTNYKKKSVIGLNFDFLGLNLVGFTLYSLYNVGFYFCSAIQDQFFERNPISANPVQLNDIFFSIHAMIVTMFTIVQCCMYERGTQKVSMGARALIFSYVVWLAVVAGVVVFLHKLEWIDFLNHCSHVKLTITLVKYIPQAYMNFQRKSTSGWSIGNVLLDLVGGVFSILQMIILAINFDDWDGFFIDTTKLGLGLFSVCFDILFMIQHYVLYRDNTGIYNLNGSV